MAFTIVTQTLIDGPRNSVFKVTGDIAGTSQAQSTIITAHLLSSMLPGFAGAFPPTLLRIDHIDYSITDGIIVQLLWHATVSVPIVELYGRGKLSAKHFGGYQNNAGAGVTGDIDMAIVASGAATPTDASVLLVIDTVKWAAGV